MRTRIKIILIAAILISAGFVYPLHAQNAIKTLDDCIQEAFSNNLTLKSGRISIEKAKAMQGTAFNIGKTDLSITQDPTSGGSPDNSLALSQGFDFPTVYTSRKNLLKAETDLEKKNFEVSRNELVKEVTGTYYQLLFARKNIDILMVQDSIYAKFLFLATAKLKTGESGKLEQMNAERLYNENKIELQKARKDFTNLQLLMQRWINTEDMVEPAENNLPTIEPSFNIGEFNANLSPLTQVYDSKIEVSQKNKKALKQQYFPSFNFALKNQLLIRGFNPYNIDRERFDKGNFMGFSVGISVPLFFWEQKSKVKAAAKDVEIARMQQQDALLSIQKTYQSYINEFVKDQKNLEYYKSVGIKQANEIQRISQLSYEKGEINYIEYIQNLKTVVEINLQYANALNQYNQTVIMLNYLQGNK